MMANKKPMLSVAEVREMVAPDPNDRDAEAVWINPGLTGVLTKVVHSQTKKRPTKDMFICTLTDLVGSAEISMTLFEQCEFEEGDVLEIFGKGLRRTVYNGLEQISTGRETEIHKVGTSAHRGPDKPAQSAPAVGAQGQFKGGFHANDDPKPASTAVYGGTVGLAMKESLAIHVGLCGKDLVGALSSSEFWAAVDETASDIIRVCLKLEKGKLAPSVRERNRTPEEVAAEQAEALKLETERLAAEEKARKEKEEAEKRRAEPAGAVRTNSKNDDSDVPY